MHVRKIVIVDEFPAIARAHAKVERAPGDEGRCRRHAGEMDVRFGVELRHVPGRSNPDITLYGCSISRCCVLA